MTAGNLICLTLVGAQLLGQVLAAVGEFRSRQPKPPICPPIDRTYLDRKADIERDARRRL